jgi:HJR/Mrr/RecB family endonuclease
MEARSPACEQSGSNPLILSMRKVSKEVLLVDSKAIKQVSYDREKRILLVLFQNGTMYSYWKVHVRTFQRLRNSYSIGKFYNRNIKNKYSHTKQTVKVI